ncbi:hypothetical protein [Amycolatopsis sp. cmx-8-4]
MPLHTRRVRFDPVPELARVRDGDGITACTTASARRSRGWS